MQLICKELYYEIAEKGVECLDGEELPHTWEEYLEYWGGDVFKEGYCPECFENDGILEELGYHTQYFSMTAHGWDPPETTAYCERCGFEA